MQNSPIRLSRLAFSAAASALFLCLSASMLPAQVLDRQNPSLDSIHKALSLTRILPQEKAAILQKIDGASARFSEILGKVLADDQADPMLLYRADKDKALPDGYEASDLASLDGEGLALSKKGMMLRAPALKALLAMSQAAKAEGVQLVVSSAYRSFAYQTRVWDRGVQSEGEAATARVSARPGFSQHQLGTAMDFGSISNDFANTRASHWLEKNARKYGFTLSFPKGLESVTGYSWESWHYRYIGASAAALEGEYFDGIQENLMLFLDALRGLS